MYSGAMFGGSKINGREFDVILFGATGYTGEHTARALQTMAAPGGTWAGVKWAIAGRSSSKLAAIQAKWGLTPTGVVVADTSDAASLSAMSARCAVIMNATGPYRFYGEGVVEACIATRTDYVDLCGEPEFIDRCLLKHADAAKAAGVLIVHACAFDSVPADIGTLYTALQFPPPALCATADMYHTFAESGEVSGAYAHATTFYAAVHGFGGVSKTRAQRRALVEKLEAESPGSSKPPPALGPKLKVRPGPAWHKGLKAYTFLFPGADSAVVRTSQRAIAKLPKARGAPYLTPQYGASFAVRSVMWAGLTTLMGMTFNVLCGSAVGRRILLAHPQLFTLGTFSDEGPSEETLQKCSFRAVFFGKGWGEATPESVPPTGFDRAVTCSVSGPEPGYIATGRMFSMMARFVREEKPKLAGPHGGGGVFTPGGLVAAGGAPAVMRLVETLRAVGVQFKVDEPLTSITPKPIVSAADAAKRPAWQTALNGLALVGWLIVLAMLLSTWPAADLNSGAPLLTATQGLECVCAFEVVQIAIGAARGNLALGAILHYTRLLIIFLIIPALPESAILYAKLVVLAWALTEVCRYPMFLLPSSRPVRVMRYAAPVFTFPLGAIAEAACAYYALEPLSAAGVSTTVYGAVAMIVPTNILGGLVAYGDLVKKAKSSLKPAAEKPPAGKASAVPGREPKVKL